MATKERGADRGSRIARRDLLDLGMDIRTARVGAGLSLDVVGRAVGLSHSQVGRIERGVHPNASAIQLARIGSVVGLDVRVRGYPGGAPLRDVAQVALLERLRVRLHVSLRLDLEVPIPTEGDQRAWDAMIVGNGRTAVEGVTRLYDLQATLRRTSLKQRDGDVDRVLLVLSETSHNRAAVRGARELIDGVFPVPARVALAALRAGSHPPGSAVVFL